MKRITIKNITFNQTIKLEGSVETFRNKGKMAFIILKDISGRVQITIEKEKHPEMISVLDAITVNSIISVVGKVVQSDYVKLNNMEMLPDSIKILSVAEVSPIDNTSFIDLKLDYRWIDLRNEKNILIFQTQTEFIKSFRELLLKKDFIEIHTPKLVGAASESGADVFELKYFDRKAYLAQSPQFYKQMAMASGFEKIFETGPVFRAENSNTSRHATEFSGFDLEMSYINSYKDVMKLEAQLLVCALKNIKQKYGQKVKELYDIEVNVPTLPFPVIKLADLYKELKNRYGYNPHPSEMGDLTTEAEKLAYKYSMEVYNHEFLFITDYKKENRAFYHMRKNGVPQGYDLIWKGVEITTGAQREHRYEKLLVQAKEKGLDEDVKFYLEFFKYGCPPHGGFGIGIDRLSMLLLNIGIKEAMFLFRGPNRLNP